MLRRRGRSGVLVQEVQNILLSGMWLRGQQALHRLSRRVERRSLRSDFKMPVCGACGEEVEVVYPCGDCGVLFCNECGDPKKGICSFCAEEVLLEDIVEDIGEDIDIA